MRKIFEPYQIGLMALAKGRGLTYQQIADKLHCHEGTVKRYLTEYYKRGRRYARQTKTAHESSTD